MLNFFSETSTIWREVRWASRWSKSSTTKRTNLVLLGNSPCENSIIISHCWVSLHQIDFSLYQINFRCVSNGLRLVSKRLCIIMTRHQSLQATETGANCWPDGPLGSYTDFTLTYVCKSSFGSVGFIQDLYPFSETNFQDFSRTFPRLRLIFQGLKNPH